MFIDEMIEVHVQHPDLTALLYREIEARSPRIAEVFKNTFQKALQVLLDFFVSAQKQKIIKSDIDPHLTGAIFFGALKSYLANAEFRKGMTGINIKNASSREKLCLCDRRQNYQKNFHQQ